MAPTQKGRMKRVRFQNRPRISRYELECGAHDCSTVGTVLDPADAKVRGWHHDKRGGYGWICPECAKPAVAAVAIDLMQALRDSLAASPRLETEE